MTPEIKIVCNDGGSHDTRGRRNIITMRRLDAPGLDGAQWREVPVKSNKQHSYDDARVQVHGAERGTRETVITPEGERLTGIAAGRTRSRNAAKLAGYDADALIGSTLHFDLRCPTCGLDPAMRADRLDRVLDQFHAAGVEQVELSWVQRAGSLLDS